MSTIQARLARLRGRMMVACDRSRLPTFSYDASGYRIYSNRAFDDLVGYEGRRLLGTRPPYPYWADEGKGVAGRAIIDEVLSGRLEALGVSSLSTNFTHASGRSFPVVLTGKVVQDGDQVLAFLNFAIPGDHAPRLPWNLFGPPRIQTTDIEPLVITVERRLFGTLDLSILTRRERQILEHLRTARRPAAIAKLLDLSTHTVRNHIKSAKRKLGVRSVIELVAALGEAALVAVRVRDEK